MLTPCAQNVQPAFINTLIFALFNLSDSAGLWLLCRCVLAATCVPSLNYMDSLPFGATIRQSLSAHVE